MSTQQATEEGAIVARVRTEASELVAKAKATVVCDEASAEAAITVIDSLTTRAREIEKLYRTLKDPIVKAGKECDAAFRPMLDAIEEANRSMKRSLAAWREQVRQEQERKEREERQRIEREQRAAEEARIKAEREAMEAARIAKEAEESGNLEDQIAAEELRMESEDRVRETAAAAEVAQAVAPIVAPPPASVASQTMRSASGASVTLRKRWVFEIVDADAVPKDYLMIDEVAIRRAITSGCRAIPGLKIFQTEAPA